MILLPQAHTDAVEAHLAEPIVDARLELVTRYGGDVLGRYAPTAGTIRWDDSRRRGLLDVDLTEPAEVLTDRHPLAALGQTVEAWWTWPRIGVSVPCGHWLIADPVRVAPGRWRVAADPEGPARLDRGCWWQPEPRIITGPMTSQVSQVLLEAGLTWSPDEAVTDKRLHDTTGEPGGSWLDTLETIIAETGTAMRPDRRTPGIILGEAATQRWTWAEGVGRVFQISAAPQFRQVPNRVTVYYEEETDTEAGEGGKRNIGWSESLTSGPRRWGGPYGRVPHVERLDAPTALPDLQERARRILRQRHGEASTVTVEMRADPRVEVGDLAHVVSDRDSTDCVARVTALTLDAANGRASVECAALSGTIAGVPVGLLDNQTL